MNESTLHALSQPETEITDPLHELLETFLAAYTEEKLAEEKLERRRVVRNGYLPERTVQPGAGEVAVQIPKVRGRSGGGVRFHSALLPPYLKCAGSLEKRNAY